MDGRSESRLPEADVARFLALHAQFEELCEAWAKVRHTGEVNDHTNAEYDAAVLENLAHLHNAAEPTVAALGRADDRLAPLGPRLEAALLEVQDGGTDMFTGVEPGTYQDVWMQLHDELTAPASSSERR
jgi:hypothetical protein